MHNIAFTIRYEKKIQGDAKNKYCVYKLMHFLHYKQLLVDHTGLFFIQMATKCEIKSRVMVGNFRLASKTKPIFNCTFEKYIKSLAIKCGFTDATW